ncbi:sialidase-1-like isoform X2 [Acanthaster planci]|uniref:Sialidase-1 n=1 Tax=Acanthaster planci TaxID=133434 RepID=A0A8B7ZGT6_ACAPL|nr:sialidase-1-like isoform X2 [Acanthaster planci]
MGFKQSTRSPGSRNTRRVGLFFKETIKHSHLTRGGRRPKSRIGAFRLGAGQVSPHIAAQKTLWRHGEAEVNIYRIPLLSYTPEGHLLAATEARKYSAGDAGPKFIAIRRSLDALGEKWDLMQFIVDDGYLIIDGINLGTIIVDDEKGIIFIMYTVCNHHDQCNNPSTMLVKSLDDGLTWSKSINISKQIGCQSFAPGPGFGFQKKLAPHQGRLVSCGHGSRFGGGVQCLLSDDHGTTWRVGGYIKRNGDFVPDENQAVELSDGSIMLNIRNAHFYNCHCRMVARSYDGAESFPLKDVYEDKVLIEPACAAGLLFYRDVLFFTNPKSTTERVDLTLRWSYDNGTTWDGELQIWDKASGYSTMTAHPGPSQYIFILFEKGVSYSTESVNFVRVSLYDKR